MQGRPGTLCTMRAYYWDSADPVEGDFLRTDAGSCYRIDKVHHVTRPDSVTRFVLTCMRLDHDAVAEGAPGVHRWAFNPR